MKFLLDEHLSPGVAGICPPGMAVAFRDWRGGKMVGLDDHTLLAEAARDRLTLVTFDVATIPALLQEMAMVGESHQDVVFISSRSFAQNDLAAIAAALRQLHKSLGAESWTNRIVFLKRGAKRES